MFTYKPEGSRVPIKVWMNEQSYYSDKEMVEQMENLTRLPFAFHHVALSPDGHLGYGAPIGGIAALENTIIPNFVGADIGCGMQFVKTDVDVASLTTNTIKRIMAEVRKQIPVGKNRHRKVQDLSHMPKYNPSLDKEFVAYKEYETACMSVGTLGGGNHFWELQEASDGKLGIMIHSGSRNLGKKTADYYDKIAVDLNTKWYSSVSKELRLAFLPLDTDEGQAYLSEMTFALEFARCNRTLMMNRSMQILYSILPQVYFENVIEIHHNFARMENHFGKNVMVHRKGATSAKKGELGIIPGSQGSSSYIVMGKGNKDSFESCSHGAGRKMGRKVAQRTLDLADEIKKLDDQGIVHAIRTEKDLDEASGAYKDINVVMSEQDELVDIVDRMTPIGVIKG